MDSGYCNDVGLVYCRWGHTKGSDISFICDGCGGADGVGSIYSGAYGGGF